MIMISMPMTYNDWRTDYKKIKAALEEKGFKVAPLYASEIYKNPPEYNYEITNIPIMYMAHSFARMAISDTIIFCGDWKNARGCCLEHQAALDYGLNILYEDFLGE